ncbi:MAG: hypothetical protein R3F46_01065 [bacterium]
MSELAERWQHLLELPFPGSTDSPELLEILDVLVELDTECAGILTTVLSRKPGHVTDWESQLLREWWERAEGLAGTAKQLSEAELSQQDRAALDSYRQYLSHWQSVLALAGSSV